MSRTYRKSEETFDSYWKGDFSWYLRFCNTTEERERAKWVYNPQRNYQHWTLPKWFRNQVNRSRRARDRQELHRAVTLVDYDAQCDPWNCKTANSWGYY